jgi:transposase
VVVYVFLLSGFSRSKATLVAYFQATSFSWWFVDFYLYFNTDKSFVETRNLYSIISDLRKELDEGKYLKEHEKQYKKYFQIIQKKDTVIKYETKDDAISDLCKSYGFFALISNEKMEAITVLKVYRAKDVVEKAFGNLKDRLNMRRFFVSDEQSLDGKLFVGFVALIYMSNINKQMQVNELYKDFTMQQVINKLDLT